MVLDGEHEPMSIVGYERPFPPLRAGIPVYLAAMGPVMTRLAGEIGDGWISHELSSPAYVEQRVLPELEAGAARVHGRSRADVDVVVSACCSIDADPALARRRAAGLVGFYASVRTYQDFFDFHGLADGQQQVRDAFRSGLGADHLADAVPDDMVDALTLSGTADEVQGGLGAYEGLVDTVKLSPPTHGVPPEETRRAQDEIIRLIARSTRRRAA
jgi:alkanesulfonate monooxygenase SsuD/methylene tetrahydromethanopterin reductase-like flavin-dependent oxidoreductase (luciferase family)